MDTQMDAEKLLYRKESFLIRGACFGIQKKFGGAFKESVVHKALIAELKHQGLKVVLYIEEKR